MNQSRLEQFKARLEAERDRLKKELLTFASPDPAMAGDWDTAFPPATLAASSSHASLEERADIREEFESALAQEHSLESRLAEVNRALERIAAGTFGQCRKCGREISEERLGANPAAEYDMEHQPR